MKGISEISKRIFHEMKAARFHTLATFDLGEIKVCLVPYIYHPTNSFKSSEMKELFGITSGEHLFQMISQDNAIRTRWQKKGYSKIIKDGAPNYYLRFPVSNMMAISHKYDKAAMIAIELAVRTATIEVAYEKSDPGYHDCRPAAYIALASMLTSFMSMENDIDCPKTNCGCENYYSHECGHLDKIIMEIAAAFSRNWIIPMASGAAVNFYWKLSNFLEMAIKDLEKAIPFFQNLGQGLITPWISQLIAAKSVFDFYWKSDYHDIDFRNYADPEVMQMVVKSDPTTNPVQFINTVSENARGYISKVMKDHGDGNIPVIIKSAFDDIFEDIRYGWNIPKNPDYKFQPIMRYGNRILYKPIRGDYNSSDTMDNMSPDMVNKIRDISGNHPMILITPYDSILRAPSDGMYTSNENKSKGIYTISGRDINSSINFHFSISLGEKFFNDDTIVDLVPSYASVKRGDPIAIIPDKLIRESEFPVVLWLETSAEYQFFFTNLDFIHNFDIPKRVFIPDQYDFLPENYVNTEYCKVKRGGNVTTLMTFADGVIYHGDDDFEQLVPRCSRMYSLANNRTFIRMTCEEGRPHGYLRAPMDGTIGIVTPETLASYFFNSFNIIIESDSGISVFVKVFTVKPDNELGRIKNFRVFVEPGQKVKTGDPLIHIIPPDDEVAYAEMRLFKDGGITDIKYFEEIHSDEEEKGEEVKGESEKDTEEE